MNFFFESQFLSYLKGFCKNHSAQYALLKVSEKWKEALDKGKKVGTIFMNLSKAYIWNFADDNSLYSIENDFKEIKAIVVFWEPHGPQSRKIPVLLRHQLIYWIR